MIDHELDRKLNIEREQEWNKRNPKLSRPTSSLSLHSSTGSERVRTHSLNHLSRPDSAQSQSSVLSPNRQLHRHHSFSNTSRASSPAGSSRASQNGKEESEEEEVIHERERNWNSPQPKWSQHASASRAQPRGSPSASSHFPMSTNTRIRAESLKSPGTVRGESPIYRDKAAESASLRANGQDSPKMTLQPRAPSPLQVERSRLSPAPSRTPAHVPRLRSPLPTSSIDSLATCLQSSYKNLFSAVLQIKSAFSSNYSIYNESKLCQEHPVLC
jgi:serine/arginine repetitive matrix protein 2